MDRYEDLVNKLLKVSEELYKVASDLEKELDKAKKYVINGYNFTQDQYDACNYCIANYSSITKDTDDFLKFVSVNDFNGSQIKEIGHQWDVVKDNKSIFTKDFSSMRIYYVSHAIRGEHPLRLYLSSDVKVEKLPVLYHANFCGVDIEPYINLYNSEQLYKIIDCLLVSNEISPILNPDYSSEQMQAVFECSRLKGFNTSILDPSFSEQKINLLKYAYLNGLDYMMLANSKMSVSEMTDLIESQLSNKNVAIRKQV